LGVLNKWDANTETKLRNQALAIIRDAAIEQWILDDAIINAKAAIQSILGTSTMIHEVTIIPDDTQPDSSPIE
jgi:hypothetical protein